MSEKHDGENLSLEAWMLLHRTRDLLFRCNDRAVAKFGLTAEQYSVLLAIECLEDPVRPTDVGRWVDHKVNTVSMIVDRMVRADLVERVRDLPDRRAVRLVMTKKGKKAFEPATAAVWKLVGEIMSPLPHEDTRALIGFLGTLTDGALKRLNAGKGARESRKHETIDTTLVMKRLSTYVEH